MPITWSALYSLLTPPAALRDVFAFPRPTLSNSTRVQQQSNESTDNLDINPSPYTHRSPSLSSTSTNTSSSSLSVNPPQSVVPSTNYQPAPPRRSATHVVALDPLSREFPKPEHEPSLDELLARKPLRYSLQHTLKNPRSVAWGDEVVRSAKREEEEKEEKARKFAEVKRKLLEAKEELDRGVRRI
ncbi:hypothetical protein VTJ04DRAFT_464 [Mycothermus thermophilus]|uniref:uncharacterized protein n=1 Tax=Humicola insolens TaxID=85995 RepID=UPI0037428EBA